MKSKAYVDELKNKSIEELAVDLTAAKKELFSLKFRNATNQLDNTAQITLTRKNIARIMTVMTQKEKGLA